VRAETKISKNYELEVDFLHPYVFIVCSAEVQDVRERTERNMKFLSQLITFDSAPINLLVFSITPLPDFLSDTVERQVVATYSRCNYDGKRTSCNV
jgi:hypothetical protein